MKKTIATLLRELEERGIRFRAYHGRRILANGNLLDGPGEYYSREDLQSLREDNAYLKHDFRFSGTGGKTLVRLDDEANGRSVMAVATCRDDENFSKKQGLLIALGRALCELDGEAERRRTRKEGDRRVNKH